MKRLIGLIARITLMRWVWLAAVAALLWFRVRPPTEWSPAVIDLLRGICCACLVVRLTRYAVVVRSAPRPWSGSWWATAMLRIRHPQAGGTQP